MAGKDKTHSTVGERLYRLLETLFREIDQESIHREVSVLRDKHPAEDRRELAKILTRKAAVSAGAVGAGAGATGGALGVLAMAPDIFNLIRVQSRLILSIAFLYDQKPHLRDRFKEVLATLAISTGASAGRQGVRYLLRAGLEGELAAKVARRIAGRLVARKLPDVVPFIGGLAGAGLNYAAVSATGRAAVEYYEHLAVVDASNKSAAEPAPAPARAKGTKAPARKRTVRASVKKKAAPRATAAKKPRSRKSARPRSTTPAAPGRKGSRKRSRPAPKAPSEDDKT